MTVTKSISNVHYDYLMFIIIFRYFIIIIYSLSFHHRYLSSFIFINIAMIIISDVHLHLETWKGDS